MPTQIVVIAGPDKGRVFPLNSRATCTIGRGTQTHTHLADPAVSRVHCTVSFEGGRAIVADAKSGTGTYVNQRRVTTRYLEPGDVIQVGDTQMRFEHDVADDKTVAPRGQTVQAPTRRGVSSPAPEEEIVFANKAGGLMLPRPIKELYALVGKPLGGYQLLEILGTGLVGVVFKAKDTKDQKLVALKVLRADFAKDRKAMQRFVRGIMAVRSYSHPNLVELVGAGIAGTNAWIAMELIDGTSLAEVMRAPALRGNWRLAHRVAEHVGRALDFLHARGIIHRAVMPQNILLQKGRQVAKLGDATLAKALEGNVSQEVTDSGELVGNIFFMAPECTLGSTSIDGRADLYSLGVTVYSLLTGCTPFQGKSMPEVLRAIRQTMPEPLCEHDPAIPSAFSAIVSKMLAKEPEDRQASAAALLDELAAVSTAKDHRRAAH